MNEVLKWTLIVIVFLLISNFKGVARFFRYLLEARLHEAAKSGDMDKATRLIQSGSDINARDPQLGLTPLHYAVRNKHPEIAELLIRHGAKISIRSSEGDTALDWAWEYLGKEKRRELLMLGVDANEMDLTGRISLHLSAEAGEGDLVEELIDRGSDVNAADKDGWTPLLLALTGNHEEVAKTLLAHGADASKTAESGTCSLNIAAAFGSFSMVELLLTHGADPNHQADNGWAPLHYACYQGHTDVTRLLLDKGAKQEIKDGEGRTPKELALKRGFSQTAALFHR